jgi:hypothetical protein
MSKDAFEKKDATTKDATESKPSSYESQELNLSKFFQPWPEKLKLTEGDQDGTVETC